MHFKIAHLVPLRSIIIFWRYMLSSMQVNDTVRLYIKVRLRAQYRLLEKRIGIRVVLPGNKVFCCACFQPSNYSGIVTSTCPPVASVPFILTAFLLCPFTCILNKPQSNHIEMTFCIDRKAPSFYTLFYTKRPSGKYKPCRDTLNHGDVLIHSDEFTLPGPGASDE